jgi:CDP-archaeol synthase
VNALLVFLPVIGASILHAPVLRLDLLPALKAPLDGGRTWRGRRLLGDNKTWRGALFMVAGVVLAALALWQWPWYREHLPEPVRDAGPLVLGALVGLGTVLGELPNSFLKRRLGVAPGSQHGGVAGALLSILDQGDLVLGIWVLLAPVYVVPLGWLVVAFVVVSVIHMAVGLIGYAVGARTAPV